MKLLIAVSGAFFLLAAGNPALAQCTTSDGHSANYGTVRLVLNNPSGMPAAVQQGINDAVAAWNNSSCNDGDDFPSFSLREVQMPPFK